MPLAPVSHPNGRIGYVQLGGSHDQPGLFASPRRLFTCTPSKLAAFEDCPRRYRYTYLDRPSPPKGPRWAHNSLGVSVHAALKSWFSLPADRRDPSRAPTLLRATWVSEGYRDEIQQAETYRRALGWLERYLAGLDPAAEPLGVERTVAAKTTALALSGRVDRVDQRGDELVIVDYKTGRTPPTSDDVRGSRALALYAYAAQRVFRRPCSRVELHHLPTGVVVGHDHAEGSLGRQVRRAEETARDAVLAQESMGAGQPPDQAFPTRISALCGWCDYRGTCPGGAEAVPRDPWAAIEARPGPA
jgi:RecB family exonuclease